MLKVKREKAVYCALNMLSVDLTRKCLVAEGWCPAKAKPQVSIIELQLILMHALAGFSSSFLMTVLDLLI